MFGSIGIIPIVTQCKIEFTYHLAGKFNLSQKEKLKNTENNVQLFGYANFGGCWTPMKGHQINFWGTAANLKV